MLPLAGGSDPPIGSTGMSLRRPAASGSDFAGVTAPATRRFTDAGLIRSHDQEPAGSTLLATHVTRRPAHGAPDVAPAGPSFPAAATTTAPRRVALSAAV